MKKGTTKLLACIMCIAMALSLVFAFACGGDDKVAATGITVTSAENATEIEVGQTLQLTAKVAPDKASQEVEWATSDAAKATVNAAGLVTAVAAGNVTITATSKSTPSVKKAFNLVITASSVIDDTPTGIVVTSAGNATEVEVEGTLKLNATVLPAAASQEVEWATSDASVATVAANGTVTGVKEGPVTITATHKTVTTVSGSLNLIVVAAGSIAPATDYSELPFSTHDEYMAAEKGTKLKVKGVVTYIAAISDDSVSYYMQNGTEGFYVYAQDVKEEQPAPTVGKVYAVGGSKDIYNGTHEIKTIEFFEELTEELTATPVNIDDKDASNADDMLPYQGAIVTGTATVTDAFTISETAAYNVKVTVNGKSTTLRIDVAGKLDAGVITAINAKFARVVAGTEIQFRGIMNHFGRSGKGTPQIYIFSADDITVPEATPAQKVNTAKDGVIVKGFVNATESTIELKTATAFEDVTVSWSSDNTAVIANDGTVTHPENDTVVTLTATISHNTDTSATATKVCKVNVAGTGFNATAALTLDFNDAAEANNYGQSATKPGYQSKEGGVVTDAANTVKLGDNNWILNGTLIASEAGGDHTDGAFAGRMSNYAGSKVESTVTDDYSYVQFDLATYQSGAHGAVISVSYKLTDGEDWIETEMYITVSSYSLTTYRIPLAAGAKNVRIYVVNAPDKVNIDNVILYK